jgi:transposase
MSKFSKELEAKIVSLIEEDTYSISEICESLGISRKSFYEWKYTNEGFENAIKKAMEHRDEKLTMLARRSLKRKLEGYTLIEVKTTYVRDENSAEPKLAVKSRVVTEKEYAPDIQAIKLTLARHDAAHSEEAERQNRPEVIVVSTEAEVEPRKDAFALLRERGRKKREEFVDEEDIEERYPLPMPDGHANKKVSGIAYIDHDEEDENS